MAEEAGQTFAGGAISVATAELNPIVAYINFGTGALDRKDIYVYPNKYENVVIDPTKMDFVCMNVKNAGDETINVVFYFYIDGNQLMYYPEDTISPGETTIAGCSGGGTFNSLKTIGKHTGSWSVNAKRTTDPTYPTTPLISDSVAYYIYTPSLDAIATTVKIVQGTNEFPWLTGTPTGFTANPITIEPDVATTFKFELSNPGDEPVKFNVGHYVTDHYETGFLVGGTLLDTIEKDVEIAPGATGVINTQSFIASAGSLTIGSLATLRTRHLI